MRAITKPIQRQHHISFGRFLILKRDDLSTSVNPKLILEGFDLFTHFFYVRESKLKIVTITLVFVAADAKNIQRARAFQSVSALDDQRRIAALDVFTIEGVSRKSVLAGNNRNRGFKCRAALSRQHITAPDFDERAVAKEAYVLRACGSLGNIDPYLQIAGPQSRVGLRISQ